MKERNLRRSRYLVLMAVLGAAVSHGRTRADTVLNNVSDGDDFYPYAEVTSNDSVSQAQAGGFTTGPGNWQVNSVTALISTRDDDPVAFSLIVTNNSDPQVAYSNPGSTLGSFDITGTGNLVNGYNTETYYPNSPLALNGGTSYWLEMVPSAGTDFYWEGEEGGFTNTNDGWMYGESETVATTSGGGTELVGRDFPMIFSLDATSVPEPGTISLIGVTATALLLRRRRFRQPCVN